MIVSVDVISFLLQPLPLGAFLPIDSLFSTQGIMVMLLAAYGVAMWMFLTSAPKVHTIMVTNLEVAQNFYEGVLELAAAEVPLHYYYNYEQTLGATSIDPLYMSTGMGGTGTTQLNGTEGLWYQLKKNTQLHVISGASYGAKNNERHVCFDHECLEQLLMRVQMRRLKYKVRKQKPLNFLVKDWEERVIELAEVSN
ncbi:MAG: glyoxalase-like domain protein [Symploca sp. SIO3C6]|uniref:Glyoxalase-like domain protein n=1 Tax=Symploca sp. SIO1C4 TaxID=2607765 RepID=A0A6B3NAD8_9CYAN|nr:glyoxalase-like domain protein [Symploca sp. SIO3C6]NER28617.1 glyoxalase-like domain protein [Symploca sp. SIO1C4]NET08345.1 glyoxalase-like domain protein [Symploca sp. SIO2B6]